MDNKNSHTFIDEMIYFPGGHIFSAISRGYDDTIAIAHIFASILASGDIVCMDGDLGAGKTAFASGIAAGLGIEGIVPSPTFTILHEYFIRSADRSLAVPDRMTPDCRPQNPSVSAFYHFDVYRLSGEEDFYSMGFDEYLGCEGSVCVVEWAEKIRGVLPPSVIQILLFRSGTAQEDLDMVDELRQERRILFYFPEGDPRPDRLCQALQGQGYHFD
ncbi:MAG: tRNA (adenosine(37)-N6)-threonylcarbamoyltransferase complex ATPase subunit type 1 TsaE [Saccharofermentanales bacterium]